MWSVMTEPSTSAQSPRWVLTLSGGGLRATLFHLGVVRRLWQAGDLGKVCAIFSVSGGSILAAHLRLHWRRYTGDEAEFDRAARETLNLCGSDIRGRVLRRTLLSWLSVIPLLSRVFGRIAVLRRFAAEVWPSSFLVKEYDRFYKHATLRRFSPALDTGMPRLYILSTSLSTGELCVFRENEFVVRKKAGPPASIPAEIAGVSLAVAASSAYPALFSPILVNAQMLLAPPDKLPEDHYLSDGGLFDNLGAVELRASGEVFDRVIVCDAGAAMTIDLKRQPWGFFKRAIRTTDVIMNRAADGVLAGMHDNPAFTTVSIHDTLDSREVDRNSQMTVGAVRTDLDVFDLRERNLIANHGYQVAGRAVYADDSATGGAWFPEPDAYRGPLTGSASIRWSRLFQWTDWCTWANLALAVVWLYTGTYAAYYASGAMRAAYLEHEQQEFLEAADLLANRTDPDIVLFALHDFVQAERPHGLGELARLLRLHKAGRVHNGLASVLGIPAPLPVWGVRYSDNRIEVLHQIGDVWKRDQSQRYEQLRDDTYLLILRLTDELVDHKTRDSRASRIIDEFFRLYWGRMVALESRIGNAGNGRSSVEQRMVEFGHLLEVWTMEGPQPEALPNARDTLRATILSELRALRGQ
jgi:predicted acylesterase/phospholipase RssA